MCRRAVQIGLAEIGFCEHVEFEPTDPALGFLDYERYSETLDHARSQYAAELAIRKGVEIDYGPAHEAQIREWLDGKDFDFLVGSVHYVDHIAFDIRGRLRMPPEMAIQKYYTKVREAVESRLFDVIAHFDFIRSYISADGDHTLSASDIIDGIFERMIANRIHLEINSRRRADREPFPSKRLISQYVDKGGGLFSFGSDAHSVERLGTGIAQAMDLLRSLRPKAVHVLFEDQQSPPRPIDTTNECGG
jgi:histidinol-phosphatase (PHP family)